MECYRLVLRTDFLASTDIFRAPDLKVRGRLFVREMIDDNARDELARKCLAQAPRRAGDHTC